MAGITQKKLAELLNLTPRQVRNLTDDGTFSRKHDPTTKQLVYDEALCAETYYRRKFEKPANWSRVCTRREDSISNPGGRETGPHAHSDRC